MAGAEVVVPTDSGSNTVIDGVPRKMVVSVRDIAENAPAAIRELIGKDLTEEREKFRVRVRSCTPYDIATINRNVKQGYYVFDSLRWAREVIGFIPDPQQEPVLANYIDNQFNTIKSGHDTGKSCMASVTSLHFLTTRHRSIVPSTAPSRHQLHDILWKEHYKWINRSPYLSKMLEWSAEMVKVRGYGPEWHAIARTSRSKSGETSNVGLQGFHAGPHSGGLMYVIDEASGVPESSMSAVEGALSEPDIFVYMGGNPTHLTGTFYDSHHKDKKLWPGRYTLSSILSMVGDVSFPTRIADKYGIQSDEYRIKILGEFPLQETFGLVPMSDVVLAFELDESEVLIEDFIEAGLDVALSGANRTIMYLRKGNLVFKKLSCSEVTEPAIARWCAEQIKRYNISHLTIDAIGPGSSVYATLRETGFKPVVRAFKSGAKPVGRNKGLGWDEDEEFYNIRAQAYWYLRGLFTRGEIALAYAKDDEDLRVQLATIMVDRTNDQNKLQIESKDKMRHRGMASPDEADALMLCFSSDIHKMFKSRVSRVVMEYEPRKSNIFHTMLDAGPKSDLPSNENDPFDIQSNLVRSDGFWSGLP